jgi:hypothetical protein
MYKYLINKVFCVTQLAHNWLTTDRKGDFNGSLKAHNLTLKNNENV